MVKRRGQKVRLRKKDSTGSTRELTVVLADSKMGYLAKDKQDNWDWYPPAEWEEVK